MGRSYYITPGTLPSQAQVQRIVSGVRRVRSSAADRKPTWTFLTEEVLRTRDDFMDFEQLKAATGANSNQMSATIHHLVKVKVIGSMEVDGKLWFYYNNEDTRTKVVEERTPEEPGTRRRSCRRRVVQEVN